MTKDAEVARLWDALVAGGWAPPTTPSDAIRAYLEASKESVAVSDEMVERALFARVPGGAQVWAWLPQADAWTPHQTARDVMRCALEAAIAGVAALPVRVPMKLHFDNEWLKSKIEEDGDEGEIGAGFELLPLPARVDEISEAQIKYMVDRFLCWRLPENFRPDAGISFKADFNEHTAFPMKHQPSGTNLFDATQADAMVRNMLEGMPSAAHPPKPAIEGVECGWQIVPKEPTLDMEQAFWDEHAKVSTVFADVPDLWRAMLSAAPVRSQP